MLKILIEDSDGNSKLSPINPENQDITIGRKEDNFIRLKERNVSRHHARIYMDNGTLMIEPVAARYGLKVNSAKIDAPTALSFGDEIHIGDYRLYIQDDNAPDIRKQKEDELAQVLPIEPAFQPRLVVVSSNFVGSEFRIVATRIRIGRGDDCEIKIQHNSVSGHHAEIRKNIRGEFEIIDLKSSNGTIINGVKISDVEPYTLSSGDFIVLGHVVMRYCGPGDLWSLNFGMSGQPKRNTALFLGIMIMAVILAVVVTYVLMTKLHDSNNGGNANNAQVNEELAKNNDLMKYIMDFKSAIEEENLNKARQALDNAEQIDFADERVLDAKKKYEIEEKAQKALDNIEYSLKEKKCRDAMDEYTNVFGSDGDKAYQKTIAYRKSIVDKIDGQINDCLDAVFLTRAMDSIERGDFADAEIAKEEIRKTNSNSPNIAKIEEAIRAKRSHGSRGGGGGGGSDSGRSSGGGGGGGNATAEAAPAESKEQKLKGLLEKFDALKNGPEKVKIATEILKLQPRHAEANCVVAINAKISKDTCKAYKHYKIVKDQGKDCQPKIGDFLQKNAAACEK